MVRSKEEKIPPGNLFQLINKIKKEDIQKINGVKNIISINRTSPNENNLSLENKKLKEEKSELEKIKDKLENQIVLLKEEIALLHTIDSHQKLINEIHEMGEKNKGTENYFRFLDGELLALKLLMQDCIGSIEDKICSEMIEHKMGRITQFSKELFKKVKGKKGKSR